MLVPWPERVETPRLPKIAERAITIQQLRSLRLFLQRLCKTGLLRSAFRDNERINWFEVHSPMPIHSVESHGSLSQCRFRSVSSPSLSQLRSAMCRLWHASLSQCIDTEEP